MEFDHLLSAYMASAKETPEGLLVLTQDTYAEQIVDLCSPLLRFRRFLAIGAEAVLLLVRDKMLEVPRVLKIARPDLSERAKRRFERSAKTLANLQAEEFPTILQFSRTPLFVLLDWSSGVDLRTYANSKQYSKTKGIGLFWKLCRAVKRLHDSEIVHRDIKPENIVAMDEKRVKLIDFGIAKGPKDQSITAIEYALGTANYAAPEQLFDAASVDVRADVFSLGRLFYFLCTRQETWNPKFLEGAEMDFFSLCTAENLEERAVDIQEVMEELADIYPDITGPVVAVDGEYTDLDALEDLLVLFRGNTSKIQIYTGMPLGDLNIMLRRLKERRASC